MQILKTRRKREVRIVAVLYLLPLFFVIGVYIIYSLISVFNLSLYQWNGIDPEKTFVGLGNWKALAADSAFIGAVFHNLEFVVLSILIQMPIAIVLAYFLFGLKRGPSNFLSVVYYLPSLFSTSAVGLLFFYLYNSRNGIFTTVSKFFGGRMVDVLGKSSSALMGVFSVVCWTAIPFYIMFYFASLSGLPGEVFEAATVDGANAFQKFFYVVLPLLAPSIKTGCTLSMIGSLKYFELVYIMTNGGPNYSSELMATYMYRTTFRYRQFGYGASIAASMFLIVSLFSLVFLYLVNIRSKEA